MREIVVDTETTGLDPAAGHRLVEIGAVELVNKVATGRRFHAYVNPQRDMPDDAFRVHGLSAEFLSDKPPFAAVASGFLEFVEQAPLVIHNAEFDIRFLDHELARAGLPALGMSRAVDSLALARRKHVGASNSLDSLCARYGISTAHRTLHGALLDANLLALVYLELCGGSKGRCRSTSSSRRWPRLPRGAGRRGPLRSTWRSLRRSRPRMTRCWPISALRRSGCATELSLRPKWAGCFVEASS